MNKVIIIVVALALLGGGVFFLISQQDEIIDDRDTEMEGHEDGDDHEDGDEHDDEGEMAESGDDDDDSPEEAEVVIRYTDDGYVPSNVEINVGETVRFVNESSRDTWPASAVHPTHTVYPGSNIGLCGTTDALGIFDSCGGVAPGESWSFTFSEFGEWGYHDHLRANHRGTITVN